MSVINFLSLHATLHTFELSGFYVKCQDCVMLPFSGSPMKSAGIGGWGVEEKLNLKRHNKLKGYEINKILLVVIIYYKPKK